MTGALEKHTGHTGYCTVENWNYIIIVPLAMVLPSNAAHASIAPEQEELTLLYELNINKVPANQKVTVLLTTTRQRRRKVVSIKVYQSGSTDSS